MSTEKLLKTVPIIQNQMDALLDFNVSLAARTFLTYSQLVQTCKIGRLNVLHLVPFYLQSLKSTNHFVHWYTPKKSEKIGTTLTGENALC